MRLSKAPLILATVTMIKIQDLIEHDESAETLSGSHGSAPDVREL